MITPTKKDLISSARKDVHIDLSKLEQVENFCEEIKVKFKQINFLSYLKNKGI